MKKILPLILLLAITVGAFAGCGSKTQDTESSSTGVVSGADQAEDRQVDDKSGGTEAAKEDNGFPMTVKDARGTEMTIAKKPEKIVSLTLGTDEMLFRLVDESRIKGITFLSEDPGLSNIVDIAKEFPVKLNNEVEKIISLQPDIVFAADWADEKVIKQLQDAKINVYAYKTPNGIEDQKKTVMEIARLVGEQKKGEELVKWMEDELKKVEEKMGNLADNQKLTALSLDSFFYTYGKNTTFDDIAGRAGLVNLASKESIEGWQQLSKEKVVEMNPDVIFLPSWSYEGFDAKEFAEEFKSDRALAEVSAVKNNRVLMLSEAHMTSVSHNIVLGVEDAAKAVYPELFK